MRRGKSEKALGKRTHSVRSGRQHREIFRVVEVPVDAHCHHADGELLVFNNNRHRRRGHVGGVRPEQQIDFVDVDELVVDTRHVRWIALIVVDNEFHRAAEEAALGVDVVAPQLKRKQKLFAVLRYPAGHRQAEADLDRFSRRSGRLRHEQQTRDSCNSRTPNGSHGRSPGFALPARRGDSYCIISSPGITPHRLEADGSFSHTLGRCGLSRCQGRGSK